MKVGDKIPVTVAGAEVTQAEIKEVGDGTVTFIVPAKRVVMSVRTELDPNAASQQDTTGTQHVVDEVVRTPAAPENTGDSSVQTTNVDASSDASVADKVLTSSSVPTENPGDPQNYGMTLNANISPEVQAQINRIVAEHLAARAKAEADEQAQE